MSDLSDTSPHSDPTYQPDPEDLERITKSKLKRKPTDVGSKNSKRKASESKSQKSPVRTVSQNYEKRQDEKKRKGLAKTRAEQKVEKLKEKIAKNNKEKEEEEKARKSVIKGKQSDKLKAKNSAKAMSSRQLEGESVAIVDEPSLHEKTKVTHKRPAQRKLTSMLETRNTQETEDCISDVEPILETPDEETHVSTDDDTQYVPTPKKRTRKREKTSIIWNHVHNRPNQPYLFCDYCNSKWGNAGRGNSTSTIRTHLLKFHEHKLSPEELASISQVGESSGAGRPIFFFSG